MPRTICLIASPPRSASSAVSRMVEAMGFSLGVSKTTVENRWNPRGYFENSRLLNFHHKTIVGQIFDPRDRSATIRDFDKSARELAALLVGEFGNEQRIVIKDPRLFQISSLYCAAFRMIPWDIELRVVHIWRSCDATVASMLAFNRKVGTEEDATGIWRNYHRLISDVIGVFADSWPTNVFLLPLVALSELPDYTCEALGAFLGTNIPSAAEAFEEGLINNGT